MFDLYRAAAAYAQLGRAAFPGTQNSGFASIVAAPQCSAIEKPDREAGRVSENMYKGYKSSRGGAT